MRYGNDYTLNAIDLLMKKGVSLMAGSKSTDIEAICDKCKTKAYGAMLSNGWCAVICSNSKCQAKFIWKE